MLFRSTATDFAAASDERLKFVVSDLENTLELLKKIRTVKYYWKEDVERYGTENSKINYGFLAQNLQKIIPELVVDVDGRLSVLYEKIVPLLVSGMKDQQKQIDDLIKRVDELSK